MKPDPHHPSTGPENPDGPLAADGGADIDIVLPFQIERSAIRGRLVRLGPSLDRILKRHDYPAPVAFILAELTVLAVILAKALKFDGIFTLQIKGDGPVKMMVADVTSAGVIRAYAQFDAPALAAASAGQNTPLSLTQLCGKGYLAFTVDQGANTDRYQGIVALEGEHLMDAVRHYFAQSEQLATEFTVTAGQVFTHGGGHRWVAGGIMIQRLPPQEAEIAAKPDENAAESWRRASIFLQSCKPSELADADLKPSDLLYRLFHEDGVRVFKRQALIDGCRCSRERVAVVLRSLTGPERAELAIDGVLAVTCEFCNESYDFNVEDFIDDPEPDSLS